MQWIFGAKGFRFPKIGRRLLFHGSSGLALGIILGLTLFTIIGLPRMLEPGGLGSNQTLLRFSSYEELRDFLNQTGSTGNWYYDASSKGFVVALAESSSVQFSRTNIQVEGVDEADIVKSDGEYIYLVSGNTLIIVRAYPPEDAEVLSKITFNGTVTGVFVNGDRLVVFQEDYGYWIEPREGESEKAIIYPGFGEVKVHVRIFNIEDRENPVLAREITVNGGYFTSRMIGNYVYAIVNQPATVIEGVVPLPVIKDGDHAEKVEASDVYYANVSDYFYAFTTVLSVDIMTDEAPKHEVFLVGATSAVYVSRENIYVTIPKMPVFNEESQQMETTEIHRIQITDGEIKYETSGVVPGFVLNQFSMDEYDGYFRIATTTHTWRNGEEPASRNNVYILNMDLNVTGKIEDIAPGETIYSARFMGERGYLVTFKKIDPFFVIDLSDPANPEILGKLKITGYSDYLHPYDENRVIGIGKETIEAEEGDFAWYQGVKISFFDVSDVENPIEIDKYEIGDRGTDSPILWDHKALLFDKEKNLLAIPVLEAKINEEQYPGGVPSNAYGDYVWQGLYVFDISEDGLELRGRITHIEDLDEYMKSGFYFSSDYMVQRSLYIEDVLYTISAKKIKMNNLADLSEIGEVEL